jgi:galactokinase
MIPSLQEKWHHYFGDAPPDIIVRSPGRVNIIGEHTDYNEGWVMPGAISKSVYILLARSNTPLNHWVADDLRETYKSETDPIENDPKWALYVHGVGKDFMNVHGAHNILITGDLPLGAGLSSSSAMVCGLLFAFQTLYGKFVSKESLAVAASQLEKDITGLQGGIMDQYAVILSKEKKVMLLDCHTRTYNFLSAELPNTKWILLNTKVSHRLIDSDYNTRAAECQSAVRELQINFPEIKSLRDVTLDMLDRVSLPDKLMQRARYVVEENLRVHEMTLALEKQDAITAGELIKASHTGLQYDFEVSCPELDHLASFANNYEGVFGARMMGGGFGGCVLCLVDENVHATFIPQMQRSYRSEFGFEPDTIAFTLVDGVEILDHAGHMVK